MSQLRLKLLLFALIGSLALVFAGCGDDDTNENTDTAETDTMTGDVLDDSSDVGTDEGTDTNTNTSELCGDDLLQAALGTHEGLSTDTVVTTPNADGTFETVVTLSSSEDVPYLYVRLVEGTSVPLTDAESFGADAASLWDIAFHGVTIRTNSGVSGLGGAEITALSGATFDQITDATPMGVFRTDSMTAECGEADMAWTFFDSAIGNEWPTQYGSFVYILRRVDGELIKLEITGTTYGDTTNTFTLHWGPLTNTATCDADAAINFAVGPINSVSTGTVSADTSSTPMTADIDASAGGMSNAGSNPYVYFDLDAGAKVDITDVEAFDDLVWDIAIKRVVYRVNGGDSGAGGASVAFVDATSLDDVTAVPADDAFIMDDFVDAECQAILDPINNPETAIGTWYEYTVDHTVEALPTVYVIKTTEGAVMKMRITSYSNGQHSIEWEPMS